MVNATFDTFYTFDTYTSKIKFYKLLIKNFYSAGLLIKTCNYYYNKYNISGIYVDHCGYLNGIIFSFFAEKRVAVYTNNYPHGIYFVDYKKNKKKYLLKYENSLRINLKKKINYIEKITIALMNKHKEEYTINAIENDSNVISNNVPLF